MVRRQELTSREVEILKLVAVGKRNKDIAAALHVSEATIENHLHKIFVKLNVSTRTEAAWYLLHNITERQDKGNPS